MVGYSVIGDRQRVHSHRFKRLHPFMENGASSFIALQIDATKFAATIINIEVDIEPALFGLLQIPRAGLRVALTEMILHIGSRAEQAFLFTRPKSDADGALHVQTGSFQNAHHFEHDGLTDAIIRGASASVP